MSAIKDSREMILKVVFVGDSGVGKTSLLRRQAQDTFTKEHLATIGVDFRIKKYKVNNISAKVQLWDTAGQQRFRSIQKPYYRGSHAICLCFNLNDRKSFDNLSHWLDEIKGYDVQGTIYLIGCKSDLQITVPTDQILIFAQAHQVTYVQTSAKENEGVNESFRTIVENSVQQNLINLAFDNKVDAKKEELLEKPMNNSKSCAC